MKTADLTGAELDYWTARAEGVPADELEIRPLQRGNGPSGPPLPDSICVRKKFDPRVFGGEVRQRINYSTNWALTGPLLEKSGFEMYTNGPDFFIVGPCKADRLLTAICRAVVRAAFGDEVEDLPC